MTISALTAAVLVFLIRTDSLLTGGLSYRQKALSFTIWCVFCRVIFFLGIWAKPETTNNAWQLFLLYCGITAILSLAYFYLLDKTCNALHYVIMILGGAILIVIL